MTTAFSFLLAVGLLVFLHEMGHYAAARSVGVYVERFSVGFGPKLVAWRDRRGCEWVLALLPLGGYVKMWDDAAAGEAPALASSGSDFASKSLRARSWIVVAGPLVNLVFAAIAFTCLAMIGRTEPAPIVEQPLANSPAALAGLRGSDRILEVDGQAIRSFSEVRWHLLRQAIGRGEIRTQLSVLGSDGQARELLLVVPASTKAEEDPEATLARTGLAPESRAVVITRVLPGSPAERAGLLPGLVILGADGVMVSRPDELISRVKQGAGAPIELEVVETTDALSHEEKPGTRRHIRLEPARDSSGSPRLGIGLAAATELVERRAGFFEAAWLGVLRTIQTAELSLKAMGRMLIGDLSWRQLSGPASIADAAGQSAAHGPLAFLSFLGLVSVSIGVLNLLPLPLLDGGHLLYHFFEWIRGRPLPEAVQRAGQRIGLALILALTILALASDVLRFFGPF